MDWRALTFRQLLELAAPGLCPCRNAEDFLRRHAHELRRLADAEANCGGYSGWLSRAVDTLDELESGISQ